MARDFDLRFCGVDILADDISAPLDAVTQPEPGAPLKYTILEINSAPGLDYYTGVGPAHEADVDAAYLEVLRAVGRGPEARPGPPAPAPAQR